MTTDRSAAVVDGYYLDLLARLNRELRPRTYLEIGVHTGDSLALLEPETLGIGIDPVPSIRRPINTTTQLFFETSDEFFARHDVRSLLGGRDLDLVFIDGMHLFEFALRDFRNVERLCGPGSVVVVHDCFPVDERSAARTRTTRTWTGDTWKLIPCLKTYRPDLDVVTITVGPSGLAMIRGLDPTSEVLYESYDEIIETISGLDYSVLDADKRSFLNAVPNDWEVIAEHLPTAAFIEPGGAPRARKARRWNVPIIRHQVKVGVKRAGRRILDSVGTRERRR